MEKLILVIKGIRYVTMVLGFLTVVVLLAEVNEKKKRKNPILSVKQLSFSCIYFELAGWLSYLLESWQEHDIMMMILSFTFFILFVALAVFIHTADACHRKREKELKRIQKEEQENE